MQNRRTPLFLYTTAVLFTLIGAGAWFLTSAHNGLLGDENIRDGLGAVWFAMLGGVAVSYKGIFDHRDAIEWQKGWALWYLGRPFSAFIVGVVTLALLEVVNTKSPPSVPAVAVAAFTLGTQERRFFAFLYEVAKLVLSTPSDQTNDLRVTTLNPPHGAAGSILIVEGQGFQAGASVTIGTVNIPSPTVASDGSSIAFIVPPDSLGASAEITVTNPDNSARRASVPFKYDA